jgi:multiple sugar transport system substrate-binding protein
VLSHKVHQTVLGEGDGDLLKEWKASNDVEVTFATFDSNPLQDRLFREASLSETDYGVGYIIDNRPTSEIASLFEPLDDYQAKDAIEDFGDISPGLVQGMTVDGKLIGIPVRHATQGLFYNEALLEEAGISAPPATLEELIDQARKLTFTSQSGTPVTGMILASDLAVFPVMFARAFGGDFITQDFGLVPDPAAMEQGLEVLRGMFEAGALPRSYATTKNDDMVTWIQQGRAAFTVLPFARNAQLNNPEQSKFPGKIKAIEFPSSEAIAGKTPMSAVVEAWGMVIPRNGAHELKAVRASKPFPENRPDLEIEGFTLKPEDCEDDIYLVSEFADELLPEDLTAVDGETVTSPERTLLDLATCTTGADLWRMLNNALTRRLTTIASLRQAIARHPRHKGSHRLVTFLDEWSGRDP